MRQQHHPSRPRVCPICDASLEGRRKDCCYCSDPCRREAKRLEAILNVSRPSRYRSMPHRYDAARNRANGATGAILTRQRLT